MPRRASVDPLWDLTHGAERSGPQKSPRQAFRQRFSERCAGAGYALPPSLHSGGSESDA
jgi:hypothetical protein